MTAPRVRVSAFAKINLSLQMVGVRPDGYHELRTRFQSLALHDTLTFTAREGPFQIACSDPACPGDSTNLVWRAAERMWRASGKRGPVTDLAVRIVKRIPMQSGLGGGSSDAVAAMRALAALWQLNLSAARLHRIAAGLGADVPFFLEGGSALGLGRGDVLMPMADLPAVWVVLVLPAFGVSTKDAFGWWDADNHRLAARVHPPVRPVRSRLTRAAKTERSDARAVADHAFGNDLQASVSKRHPEISQIVGRLERAGATYAAMSGSGSAVFGFFQTKASAERAARAVSSSRRRTLVTRTLDAGSYERLSRPEPREP